MCSKKAVVLTTLLYFVKKSNLVNFFWFEEKIPEHTGIILLQLFRDLYTILFVSVQPCVKTMDPFDLIWS